MTSNVGATHLHGLAGPGEPADVLIPLDVSGSTEGFFFGSGVFTTEELPGVAGGLVYVNVHTVDNVPGEIRGQFSEPVTINLLGLGAAALLLARRRRQG